MYERRQTRKRLLTEHLDLIILSNERAKAHKLAALMETLGLDDVPASLDRTIAKVPNEPFTSSAAVASTEAPPPAPTRLPAAASTSAADAREAKSPGRPSTNPFDDPQPDIPVTVSGAALPSSSQSPAVRPPMRPAPSVGAAAAPAASGAGTTVRPSGALRKPQAVSAAILSTAAPPGTMKQTSAALPSAGRGSGTFTGFTSDDVNRMTEL